MVATKSVEKRIYYWCKGSRAKLSAQVFGETLEGIGKRCSAETLVEHATPDSSPIHAMFEWDDEIAGHEYRLIQARLYLRSYRVDVKILKPNRPIEKETKIKVKRVRQYASFPMPARIHVHTRKLGSTYIEPEEVREDKEALHSALAECFSQMLGLRAKYAFLSELKDVWKAIDAARDKYARKISA